MLNTDPQMTIKRKDFAFPLAITSFEIDETAKVATYEFAGMDGALHERVLQYRVIHVSGVFSQASQDIFDIGIPMTPNQYIIALQRTNDNKPWILSHPILWSYNCIINSLKISEKGDNVEPDANNFPLASYDFEIEFWEHTSSMFNNTLNTFYPAIDVRPPSDLYNTTLKYRNCDELYWAIIDNLIVPWLDPIINAEWLLYDQSTRNCAYARRLENPTGENSGIWFDSKWNITHPKTKKSKTSTKVSWTTWYSESTNMYTVQSGDTYVGIGKKFNMPPEQIYQANVYRSVRQYPHLGDPTKTLKWINRINVYPGDILFIPPITQQLGTRFNTTPLSMQNFIVK